MNKSLKKLKYMQQRHRQTGCDFDYLHKLDSNQLAWLEKVARQYYDGEGEPDDAKRAEANHRRYCAKRADMMSLSTELTEARANLDYDDLDPEKIAIYKESAHLPTPRFALYRGDKK